MSGGADNADYRLGDGLGALSLQPFSVMTVYDGERVMYSGHAVSSEDS
jgi:hypothetical protein